MNYKKGDSAGTRRAAKNMEGFKYNSRWAPPSDGEDELDLTRDVHPAFMAQNAPPLLIQESEKKKPMARPSRSLYQGRTQDFNLNGSNGASNRLTETDQSNNALNSIQSKQNQNLRSSWAVEKEVSFEVTQRKVTMNGDQSYQRVANPIPAMLVPAKATPTVKPAATTQPIAPDLVQNNNSGKLSQWGTGHVEPLTSIKNVQMSALKPSSTLQVPRKEFVPSSQTTSPVRPWEENGKDVDTLKGLFAKNTEKPLSAGNTASYQNIMASSTTTSSVAVSPTNSSKENLIYNFKPRVHKKNTSSQTKGVWSICQADRGILLFTLNMDITPEISYKLAIYENDDLALLADTVAAVMSAYPTFDQAWKEEFAEFIENLKITEIETG